MTDTSDDSVPKETGLPGEVIDQHTDDLKKHTNMFKCMKLVYGMAHPVSIHHGLMVIDDYIGLYMLNEADALIRELLPHAQGLEGTFYTRLVQCHAFNLYKQMKFAESIEKFKEFKRMAGGSSVLAENMAHAYNSLGDYVNAEKCFTEALGTMSESKHDHAGGTYLGLGVLRLNLGMFQEALPVLQKAVDFYKAKYTGDHNLQAKALKSLSNCHKKLGNLEEAERHLKECVRIFVVTCGDSPLTFNAKTAYGQLLCEMKRPKEGFKFLQEGLLANQAWENEHIPGRKAKSQQQKTAPKPKTPVSKSESKSKSKLTDAKSKSAESKSQPGTITRTIKTIKTPAPALVVASTCNDDNDSSSDDEGPPPLELIPVTPKPTEDEDDSGIQLDSIQIL